MFTRETFEALDDTELSDVRGLINDVYQKRYESTQAEEEILRNLQILQNNAGITVVDGRPWIQPTGAHDVYPAGVTVTHGGGLWRSEHPYNAWEPGTGDLWTRIDDDPGEPVPIPLDDYPTWEPRIHIKAGDLYVYEGGLYSAVQAHTSQPDWAPDLVPALWKKVN